MKTVAEIAELVSGEVLGDGSLKINGVSSLDEPKEGTITFVLESNKILAAESSPASAVIVPKEISSCRKTAIKVDHPRLAMAKILEVFAPKEEPFEGTDKNAFIGKNVSLGRNVKIYPFVYIGENSRVGDNTIIYPNTTLYPRTVIGNNCIIHAGCVIGVDGFGFVPVDGKFIKIPQIGNVIIEDDVELYANTCVARGTIGSTIIKIGTKVDNLNHFAHNVQIGRHCAMAVMNAFGGSTSIGDRVQMSGQCALVPHVHVGDDSMVMGRTVITKNFPAKSILLGYPAQDHLKENKILALLRKLPELFDRVKKLEKK